MRRKISKLLEKAAGAHRPEHSAKLKKALREARHEEAEHEKQKEDRLRRWGW